MLCNSSEALSAPEALGSTAINGIIYRDGGLLTRLIDGSQSKGSYKSDRLLCS